MDSVSIPEDIAKEFYVWRLENRWFFRKNGKWHYSFEQGTSISEESYEKNYTKTTEQLLELFKLDKLRRMKYVQIYKMKDLEDAQRHSKVEPKNVYTGTFLNMPSVGSSFHIGAISEEPKLRGLHTSKVTEIVSNNVFKTRHSLYYWTLVDRDSLPNDVIND